MKDSDDLPLYTLFMTGSIVLGNLSLWLFLPKYLVRVKGINPFHDFKTILVLFLPCIASQV